MTLPLDLLRHGVAYFSSRSASNNKIHHHHPHPRHNINTIINTIIIFISVGVLAPQWASTAVLYLLVFNVLCFLFSSLGSAWTGLAPPLVESSHYLDCWVEAGGQLGAAGIRVQRRAYTPRVQGSATHYAVIDSNQAECVEERRGVARVRPVQLGLGVTQITTMGGRCVV